VSERPADSEDREQIKQKELGEREHHARMEQLQMGDENAETSLARSKAELPEPPPPEGGESRGAESPGIERGEDPEPVILKAPYTQFRKL